MTGRLLKIAIAILLIVSLVMLVATFLMDNGVFGG